MGRPRKTNSHLPRSMYLLHGAYYFREHTGQFVRLGSEREGLPVSLRRYAERIARSEAPSMVPALVGSFKTDVLPRYAEKTRKEYERMLGVIAAAFLEFDAADVKPSTIAKFLRDNFKDKANTAKKYRALLSLLFAFALELDYVERNPAVGLDMKSYKEKSRDRYIADAELAAIKAAALVGVDGKQTRSGPMIVCLIDLAYLTAQRISDLLRIRWSDVSDEGVEFHPAKTVNSSGVRLRVEMTPELKGVLERAKAFGKVKGLYVVHTLEGQKYRYSGAGTAWSRACERAGVKDAHFQDIRAKSLTDVKRASGAEAAQALGGHTTAEMTAHYTKSREVQVVSGPK